MRARPSSTCRSRSTSPGAAPGPTPRPDVATGARGERPPTHWFEPIAEHLGEAYLRYSFTKGTPQEVDYLIDALGLEPGTRMLDVGCGPGRHADELARRGISVHGVDISERFVELARRDAPAGATFERLDARALPFDAEFDAAICLCQGAFGLMVAERRRRARSSPASPGRSCRAACSR